MQNWYGLIAVTLFIFIVMAIATVISEYQERKLIKSGILPKPENTTDADILRLANSEHKGWAMKRYRQLHDVTVKEAKQKIEELIK